MQTLMLLLVYYCQKSLYIDQVDVETIFLNGKVISEVYVKQPSGYENGREKIYKLGKVLYGLRESPHSWYECFNDYITKLGFYRSEYDYCLYAKEENNESIYIYIYYFLLMTC